MKWEDGTFITNMKVGNIIFDCIILLEKIELMVLLIQPFFSLQGFAQFRERITQKEVETIFLDYSVDPCEMDKELGDKKGMQANPMMKHALT